MRIELLHIGGLYAERVVATLESKAPGSVAAYQVQSKLPLMVDDAAEFLPPALGQAEIIIAINLHQDLLVEIPYVVKGKATKALIAPIEATSWIRPGLQRQVTAACAEAGIESAFPRPFCALEPISPVIAEFCRLYNVGRPELIITLKAGNISDVKCERGSPCGLTDYVAKHLIGKPLASDIVKDAGVMHHAYPCLASMALLEETGDTLMHHSVFLLKDAVAEALKKAEEEQP
jgi:hypothetical protein